jgi:hypothetical protein
MPAMLSQYNNEAYATASESAIAWLASRISRKGETLMQDTSGIGAVSIPVSEILVYGFLLLLVIGIVDWIVRRRKRN